MMSGSSGIFGVDHKSRVGLDWRSYISLDPRFARPNDQRTLVADYTKAKEVLGWEVKTMIEELMGMMVEHDLSYATSHARAA
jgi:GDPmannose 4,6-dehydratase